MFYKLHFLLAIKLLNCTLFAQYTFDPHTMFRFNNNNLHVTINNNGVIADTDSILGEYKGIVFLYSGGFFMSGKHSDTLFVNAVASASRTEDYYRGNIAGDTLSKFIYPVSKEDTPFSSSWINWKNAVQFGADFYDGNNDGIYNPLDINNNGLWDTNEDKPAIIGDLNTFFVINDGVPANFRRHQSKPLGIEINQYTFSFKSNNSYLDNFLFVQYKIINKSGSNLDSVIFSPWADFDLGNNPVDDKVGSLKGFNSIYVYNETADNDYGSNVPTPFLSMVLSPNSFVPDVSFKDKDNNGMFNKGVDSAITNGFTLNKEFNTTLIEGSLNINNYSNNFYISSEPTKGDPNSASEVRYYGLGLDRMGNKTNPCSSPFGTVSSEDCSNINPLFYFTGDPFAKTGWLFTPPSDVRVQINSGVFNLKNNEWQEVLVAYHVGAGSTTAEGYYKGKADLDSLFKDLGII